MQTHSQYSRIFCFNFLQSAIIFSRYILRQECLVNLLHFKFDWFNDEEILSSRPIYFVYSIEYLLCTVPDQSTSFYFVFNQTLFHFQVFHRLPRVLILFKNIELKLVSCTKLKKKHFCSWSEVILGVIQGVEKAAAELNFSEKLCKINFKKKTKNKLIITFAVQVGFPSTLFS